ncbi:hypothetical protein ADL27_07675, partial [Streptomyces sp. NRRL F-6602]
MAASSTAATAARRRGAVVPRGGLVWGFTDGLLEGSGARVDRVAAKGRWSGRGIGRQGAQRDLLG